MNLDNRKAIIGFSLSMILFWLIKHYFLDEKEPEEIIQPEIREEDIQVAMTAYTNAQKANEPYSVLNDLNTEFVQQYGFRIYQRKRDGKYIITDLSGKEVKEI